MTLRICLALSLKYYSEITHFLIETSPEGVYFKDSQLIFKNLRDLIIYHCSQPAGMLRDIAIILFVIIIIIMLLQLQALLYFVFLILAIICYQYLIVRRDKNRSSMSIAA